MINGIKPNPIVEDFDTAVNNLVENIHRNYENWATRSEYTKRDRKTIEVKSGRKFIKIIHENSVWGFIAKADGMNKGVPMKAGDVLKAAGWASPAKHTRGNIFDTNQDYFSWTGPNYR